METFFEESRYQNLAIRKAEQKKLSSLKNMNMPWIFVEPTRLKTVKVPKARKTLNYYEDLDDDDLEFLGNSKIPFTKDDIQILQQSLHGDKVSATEHEQKTNSSFDNIDENIIVLNEDQNSKLFDNKDLERISQNYIPEDINEENEEDIVTSRSNEDAIDNLFASDNDKPTKFQEEEEKMEIETETVKSIIMTAVKEREEAAKWKTKKIDSNRPISFFSYDVNKMEQEGQRVVKEKMTKGRRKLLSAIHNSSPLKHEKDSITYAKNKFEKENNLKRAALEKCFGAKHFKEYLKKQNVEIPQILLNISYS